MSLKFFFLFSFATLTLINVVVFFPSFFHVAKADHLLYLYEVADLESFRDLFNYTISHNRTRLIYVGDYIYYRPIFYFVMTLERYFFKYQFMYWQITGFLLHLTLVGVLIRLLYQIQKFKWIAVLFALFFSLLYISADMVTWYHMNTYILCYIFVLLSLSNMICYYQNKITSHRSLQKMIMYMTLACLTNEFGVISCFLIMLFMLFFCRKSKLKIKQHPGLLSIPLVLYFYLSILDFRMRLPNLNFFDESVGAPQFLHIGSIVSKFFSVSSMSFFYPLCPSFFSIYPEQRNYLMLYGSKHIHQAWSQYPFLATVNLMILLVIFTLLFLTVKHRKMILAGYSFDPSANKNNYPAVFGIIGLCLALSYIFTLIIARGTSNAYDFNDYLLLSSYHFYPISLFLTIAGYCVFCMISLSNFSKRSMLIKMFIIILCACSFLNASRLYELNVREKNMFFMWGNFIQQLEQFIQTHKHEPGFSFDIKNSEQVRDPVSFLIGYPPDQKKIAGYSSDFLFRKYINKTNPKYHFMFRVERRQDMSPSF